MTTVETFLALKKKLIVVFDNFDQVVTEVNVDVEEFFKYSSMKMTRISPTDIIVELFFDDVDGWNDYYLEVTKDTFKVLDKEKRLIRDISERVNERYYEECKDFMKFIEDHAGYQLKEISLGDGTEENKDNLCAITKDDQSIRLTYDGELI